MCIRDRAYIDSDSYLPGANATQLYGYVVSSVSENNDNNVCLLYTSRCV